MANQKISELTALLGSNVADDDPLAIVDTSTTETKKINFSELSNALNTSITTIPTSGTIFDFQVGSSSIGSIGAIYGDPYFSNGTKSLYLVGSTVMPRDGSGGQANDDVNLGNNANRFQDLYLSGGVYLGGPGTANILNDYKEGTFIPVFADDSSGGNEASAATANGYYTKIGRQVYISFTLTNINTSGLTSGNDIFVTGLPFSPTSLTGDIRYSGTYTMTNTNLVGSDIINVAEVRDNLNFLKFRQSTSGDFLTVGEITSGSADFYVSLTYFA